MKPLSSTGFALCGAALIAISFGLARFAFGLFVPPIRADLELTAYAIGIIGALPLVSFSLAMQVTVKRSRHGRVSSIMNAGTSIGVIVAVPAILFLSGGFCGFPCLRS